MKHSINYSKKRNNYPKIKLLSPSIGTPLGVKRAKSIENLHALYICESGGNQAKALVNLCYETWLKKDGDWEIEHHCQLMMTGLAEEMLHWMAQNQAPIQICR